MSVSLTPITEEPLRFGYSANDVKRLANAAVRVDYSTRGREWSDRLEVAWFGIVEALYTRTEAPTRDELIRAGQHALFGRCAQDMHGRGVAAHTRTDEGTYEHMRNYLRYWITPGTSTDPGYVTRLIERTALAQVFACLTTLQREVLLALGAFGDYAKAAEALGMDPDAFWDRLDYARKAFAKLWHDHETPAQTRRRDQRVERRSLRSRVAAHFTPATIGTVLADARQVFTDRGAPKMHSCDLLSALHQLRPRIYGEWEQADLADALRACGVRVRNGVQIKDPTATTIRNKSGAARGYHKTDLDNAASTPPASDTNTDADAALTAVLEQEIQVRTRAQARVLDLVRQGGPAGTTAKDLAARIREVPGQVITGWLGRYRKQGLVVRLTTGHYAATDHGQDVKQGAA